MRDQDERWVRIAMVAGDLITLPAGMYHRFTPDAANYTKAMRLFVGEPVWVAHNRAEPAVDDMAARKAYVAVLAG